jgi:RNA polymerase sigma-70 factor (ECF subfamily)
MLLFFLTMIDTPEGQAKFERIYRAYRKLMIKVASDILHDNGLAEDAVSQAFLQLIPNLGKINDVSCHQTKNYLIIMVRRVCFAFYNERKKIIEIPYEDLSDGELEPSEDSILREMSYFELLEKIESLPDIYADVLYLAYCDDYSTKEIAALLAINVNAVKKRLERARHHLRALLEEEEVMDA